jgi:hypothetical protein
MHRYLQRASWWNSIIEKKIMPSSDHTKDQALNVALEDVKDLSMYDGPNDNKILQALVRFRLDARREFVRSRFYRIPAYPCLYKCVQTDYKILREVSPSLFGLGELSSSRIPIVQAIHASALLQRITDTTDLLDEGSAFSKDFFTKYSDGVKSDADWYEAIKNAAVEAQKESRSDWYTTKEEEGGERKDFFHASIASVILRALVIVVRVEKDADGNEKFRHKWNTGWPDSQALLHHRVIFIVQKIYKDTDSSVVASIGKAVRTATKGTLVQYFPMALKPKQLAIHERVFRLVFCAYT